MSDNLTAIVICGLVILGPVWITFHYLYKFNVARRMTTRDSEANDALAHTAARMETRMATLERLLDAQAPGWRQSEQAGENQWR
jgi:phage shock protein B